MFLKMETSELLIWTWENDFTFNILSNFFKTIYNFLFLPPGFMSFKREWLVRMIFFHMGIFYFFLHFGRSLRLSSIFLILTIFIFWSYGELGGTFTLKCYAFGQYFYKIGLWPNILLWYNLQKQKKHILDETFPPE